MRVRVGIAHHLGWAVAVTATDDHAVVDRRRIELLEPGHPPAPVEHELAGLGDDDARALLGAVRDAARRATGAALDGLASSVPGPRLAVTSISLRSWPADAPDLLDPVGATDLDRLRRAPYASRADSVLYLQVLAEAAEARGWDVHLYDHRGVEAEAARLLGSQAEAVLHGPRTALGPPWGKDHRTALAATVVAGRT